MVRTTAPVVRSTTLTESDSQLTTHASRSLRAATLTGSSPTGISAVRTGEPEESWKTESVAFGELTASRRVPSGVSASGRVCGLSKLRKGAGSCAEAGRPSQRHRRDATVSASADLRTSLLRAGATRGVRLDIGGLPVSAALGDRAARGVLCKQKWGTRETRPECFHVKARGEFRPKGRALARFFSRGAAVSRSRPVGAGARPRSAG